MQNSSFLMQNSSILKNEFLILTLPRPVVYINQAILQYKMKILMIENHDSSFKNEDFSLENDDSSIKNEDFSLENDDSSLENEAILPLKNDGLYDRFFYTGLLNDAQKTGILIFKWWFALVSIEKRDRGTSYWKNVKKTWLFRAAGAAMLRRQVSLEWQNPDFLLRNPDFLLKNGWFYNINSAEAKLHRSSLSRRCVVMLFFCCFSAVFGSSLLFSAVFLLFSAVFCCFSAVFCCFRLFSAVFLLFFCWFCTENDGLWQVAGRFRAFFLIFKWWTSTWKIAVLYWLRKRWFYNQMMISF